MTKKNNKKSTIGVLPLIEENGNAAKTVLEINSPQPKALEKAKGRTNYLGFKRYVSEHKTLSSWVSGVTTGIAALGFVALVGPCVKQPLEKMINYEKGEYKKLFDIKNKLTDRYNVLKATATNTITKLSRENEELGKELRGIKITQEAQQRAEESGKFNPQNFYDFAYDTRWDYMNLQTASLGKEVPIGILSSDPKKDAEIKDGLNKRKFTQYASRYVVNDDLLRILGEKWKPFYDQIEKCDSDILLDRRKYGNEIRIIDWVKYEDSELSKGKVILTDDEAKKIKDLINSYRSK